MKKKAKKWESNHLSKLIKKNNIRFAWICDQREDERLRGVTIDVGLH